ncbi:hypothetical protein Tco_0537205 [Tanacetum coccineum]
MGAGHARSHYLNRKEGDAEGRASDWSKVVTRFGVPKALSSDRGTHFCQNLAANHLSRLENPDLGVSTKKEIIDEFPDDHLMILKAELNDNEPWYADYFNYIVGKIVPQKWTPERRRRFFSQVKNYFWNEPYAFRLCSDNIMRRCVAGSKILESLAHYHSRPTGGTSQCLDY